MNPWPLSGIQDCLPNISPEMSNKLLKYDISKTEHFISVPSNLLLSHWFLTQWKNTTIHSHIQVPNLRAIFNFSFFYSSEFANMSHRFLPLWQNHNMPTLIISTIIIPVLTTVTCHLDLCNSLRGVNSNDTHRQELLVSSPWRHKNFVLKWKTTTSLSMILTFRSTNNFFIAKTFLMKEGTHWFVLWTKLCIPLQSSPPSGTAAAVTLAHLIIYPFYV